MSVRPLNRGQRAPTAMLTVSDLEKLANAVGFEKRGVQSTLRPEHNTLGSLDADHG
jgi:hypothetical protein